MTLQAQTGDPDNIMKKLRQQFAVPLSLLLEIAGKFHGEILNGLAGNKSSLKMLPSYLSKPSGEETGVFPALDFGGTNVRVRLLHLQGCRGFSVKRQKSMPLRDREGLYDYTGASVAAVELFDFIAGIIEDVLKCVAEEPSLQCELYPLGHTFSFGTYQTGANDAVLINWTKEIKTQGVEGQNINRLLADALLRRNLFHVKPVVILNDTVGTLLAAAYCDPYADIGSICGTGHNTCYLEQHAAAYQEPVIINMESGNFDLLPLTPYDDALDQNSGKPGEQRLEKAVSGRYLGELARLILKELAQAGKLFSGGDTGPPAVLEQPYAVSTKNIAFILESEPAAGGKDEGLVKWLRDNWGAACSNQDIAALREILSMIAERSARFVAATYLGILRHIDPALTSRHTIAVDGSLYEKMPGYADCIAAALSEALQEKAGMIKVKLTKDGSGVGAAIAAATIAGRSGSRKTV
ncbi:Hexokinase [Desulfofarcimen acetoxidans DSM 771]|uniref:Hexokinase n=1 Tax=Desulfofarcimen acetoxidans (strain ATCC 49208 / DSM 771 / KCTC 5769 / VKM B-1644 / 5575) TaxID=485916 RepID=C8VY10_DESAS|nr:hexokinase [Desulfofarcimen acetoxidans]ACV64639.1 Hexokinase [Desulfofarcimen acetoxidans DSM 771]